LDPLNAFSYLDPGLEEILSRAANSLKTREPPLSGLLLAVDDNLDVARMPTSAGSSYDQFPDRDTEAVRVAKELGASVLGKTNCSELGWRAKTWNLRFGATRLPGNCEEVAIGSSGGAAAAVSSRMCDFALALEQSGSARVSAVGFGLFAYTASPPLLLDSYGSAISIIARSLEDLAFLADWLVPLTGRAYPLAGSLRLPFCSQWQASRRVLGKFLMHHLPQAAERGVNGELEFLAQAARLAGIGLVTRSDIFESRFSKLARQKGAIETLARSVAPSDPLLNDELESLWRGNVHGFSAHMSQIVELKRRLESVFSDVDLVISPAVSPDGPDSSRSSGDGATSFSAIPFLLGLPALSFSLPGKEETNKLGLQLIARRFEDYRLFGAAAWIIDRLASQASS
jgi:Asp-tRNA(Asn)/Glu-tRNA(Gln) amidotransferase A subunit family amidase